ncbi:RCC1 and BTB domain-containing protein 1 [Camponotus floridanus]|uniref:RCC1 and BTB domain-containing protein 1 n=1 Tax=Camponotus floridanus TaxID=104421 RepID=E2A4G5_CAMFO|nr:RCC1 and BTB domain-containing protein 1 [Camponotus floridanus]
MSNSSKKFYSSEDIEKKNSETTTNEEDEMQKYEKRILQWILAEKIIPTDLKHWSFFHLLKPEFILQIHMVIVYSNCDNGVIIVTKDKNVYSLDYEEEHLKTDTHTAPYLREMKELCGKNIKTFAHSDRFILALTEEGEVYFCEIAEELKFSSEISVSVISTFIRVDDLINKRVVDIACGKLHGLALTSDGKVFAWGMINWDESSNYLNGSLDERDWKSNESEESDWEENDGQVDNKNKKSHFSVPRQVKHELERKNVVHIACGTELNIVVTDENTIYGWGDNDSGQISRIVQPQEYYEHPHKIITLSDKIIKVVCGNSHTLVLTNKGEVYAWGDNYFGQIGVNGNREFFEPIVVNVPQMGKVLNVDAFANMSIAVGYDRSIYIWGTWYMYENLMELANVYCVTNLKKDCSQIIKQTITMSNVKFLYNKAIEYNSEELKEFCFQFTLRHRAANTLSEDYLELYMSTKAKIVHKELIQNDVTITSSTFYSPNKNVEKRSLKTTTKKNEMPKYEKGILQCILAEKIISTFFKHWPFFHLLESEFISQIHILDGVWYRTVTIFIVTQDKHVYNFNYDANDFSMIGYLNTALYLREIKELCGKNIKIFQRCSSFILALTEEGEVYFSDIAKNHYWEEAPYISTFIRVINLSRQGIVTIVCGKLNGLALTNDGEVRVWKDKEWEEWEENVLEERDWEENVSEQNDWKENVLGEYDWDKNIFLIACGSYFNIAVSDENTIYGWGDNRDGQISIVRPQKYYKYPHEIITISDKIVEVACGDSHTLALTCKGEVYAWGNNTCGQVGVNSNGKPSGPTVLTSDLTIRVEERPIYVHKAILKIRCLYFKSMFRHNWKENIQNISVHTVSDKFSYVTYKAFLKYLYTGIIDLPAENVLELMELADMYCEINLLKDCSQKIIKVITVSNVMFFYNKAIEFNAKELKEFCFHFALRHMEAVVLSEDFIKLDTSTKDNFMRRAAEGNTFGISFF